MEKLYKLDALSVHMGGHLFKKEDGKIFDPEGKDKSIKRQIYDAVKAGFLVKLTNKEIKSVSKTKPKKENKESDLLEIDKEDKK